MKIDTNKKALIREVSEATGHLDNDMTRVRTMVNRLKPYYPNMTPAELGAYMAVIASELNDNGGGGEAA